MWFHRSGPKVAADSATVYPSSHTYRPCGPALQLSVFWADICLKYRMPWRCSHEETWQLSLPPKGDDVVLPEINREPVCFWVTVPLLFPIGPRTMALCAPFSLPACNGRFSVRHDGAPDTPKGRFFIFPSPWGRLRGRDCEADLKPAAQGHEVMPADQLCARPKEGNSVF